MKKRVLSIVLAICMVLTLMPTMAYAETFEDFEYSVFEDEVTITRYNGYQYELEIPSEIDGYPVTAIGEGAFDNCERLERITIPEGVRSIGYSAFHWCSNLKSITIPDSVTYIGDRAFRMCHNLKSIKIPYGVTSIREDTFGECHSLESVIIPESVTVTADGFMIMQRCLQNCRQVKM